MPFDITKLLEFLLILAVVAGLNLSFQEAQKNRRYSNRDRLNAEDSLILFHFDSIADLIEPEEVDSVLITEQ